MLLLYLRFLVDGRYVTMFWAALSVVDGTAQGLLDVSEKQFEAMKVPFSKVYAQHVRNWTRQDVVYDTAHQLTGYFKPPWSTESYGPF